MPDQRLISLAAANVVMEVVMEAVEVKSVQINLQ
jgi:hypothetical protein